MGLHRLHFSAISVTNAGNLVSGIATNTLDSPKTAFTDAKGWVIATCWQVATSADDVILVVADVAKGRLLKHLEFYGRFTTSIITATNLHIYFDTEGTYVPGEKEWSIAEQAGQVVVTPHALEAPMHEEEFSRFRLEHNMPLQGQDYDQEFLLNVDPSYVSFTKGCFLGQEVLCRVDSMSKPTKRLVAVYEDECSPDEILRMTSKVREGEQFRGFVFLKQ